MGTVVGAKAVGRVRFFTCPVYSAQLVESGEEGILVKRPYGTIRQLVAVSHYVRRDSSSISGRAGAKAAILIPVPPDTVLLEASYPALFWHLERLFLGAGATPPAGATVPQGKYMAQLVSQAAAEARWQVELQHPLVPLTGGRGAASGGRIATTVDPQMYLELEAGDLAAEYQPIWYWHKPLLSDAADDHSFGASRAAATSDPLFVPTSLEAELPIERAAVAQDPDERVLQMQSRSRSGRYQQQRAESPVVDYRATVYVMNCGRAARNEELRASAWHLKRLDEAGHFYSSIQSERLPREACLGEAKSLLRLRATQPCQENLYL